jgi:hypothetical protein
LDTLIVGGVDRKHMKRPRIIDGDLEGGGVEGRRKGRADPAPLMKEEHPAVSGDETRQEKKETRSRPTRLVVIKDSDADIFDSYKY